jgi:hypothetical protein
VKPVMRDEILDYQTWTERRPGLLPEVLRIKAGRRIHLGPHLTFLFENRDTVRYQIQEMLRTEQLVREDAIRHEIDTYNELLGGPGALGATLLVEVEDPAERDRRLVEWRDLPGRLYVGFEDGTRAYATFDARQVGEDRLSSVQFLKFECGGRAPVLIGTDLAPLKAEARLSEDQRRALAADLES